MLKILFLFSLASFSLVAQELPNGTPFYYRMNLHILAQKVLVSTSHTFSQKDFSWIQTIHSGERTLLYLALELKEAEPIHFEINSAQFPNDAELYFIDLSINGWVGPYRKQYFKSNKSVVSGRLNTKQILIEFSIPKGGKISIPITNTIPQWKSENLPPYNKNPKFRPRHERDRKNILLTGYWPPSNESIRPFSRSELLNPDGWIGEDWENRGYDIVSFFPTFNPPDCSDCGQGIGDLEVDYQDTSEDWWSIVDSIQPVAIITFSRGFIDYSWELEWKYYNLTTWSYDFTPPYLPTPNPPDDSVPINTQRYSSLPMDSIIASIDSSNLGLTPYIDYTNGAGGYLSEFMGYHGVWHKAWEDSSNTPCYFAGHVHMGGLIDWVTAQEAVKITMREVIRIADQYQTLLGDINQDGTITILDMLMLISHILSFSPLDMDEIILADVNFDTKVDIYDLMIISNIIMEI